VVRGRRGVVDDLGGHLGACPADGDLLVLVAQVELGELAGGHQANQFLQLSDVDHGGGIVGEPGTIVVRS
jgi:hypothetical protein